MAKPVPNRAHDSRRKLSGINIYAEMNRLPVDPKGKHSSDMSEYMENRGLNSVDEITDDLYTCPSCGKLAVQQYSNMQATAESAPQSRTTGRNEDYPDACPCCGDCYSNHPTGKDGGKLCPIIDNVSWAV